MSYQLELRHLRYFLAVAEDLHFRKAADRLFISQPGLSKQIKQLEEDLGVQLFERHNRSVVLTPAGLFLKDAVSRNLKDLEGMLDHARLLHSGLDGNLSLGYVGSAMQELIPDVLLTFKEEHPKVIFNLKEMDNQRQIKDLLSNEIDVGFVRLERVPRNLEVLPLLKENFCLVLPKDHPIDESNFKRLSQLKDEPFIMFDPSYSPSYYERVMQIFDDSGFVPIVSHNTIHASSIYRLVEHKLGISIVPKSLQVGYSMNVKFIELNKIKQQTVLSAVWNKENRNPALQLLLTLIKTKEIS